jgi:methyl-accepting chemotaxis protein
MARMNEAGDTLAKHSFKGMSISSDLAVAFDTVRFREYRLMTVPKKDIGTTANEIRQWRGECRKNIELYEKLAGKAGDSKPLKDFEAIFANYESLSDRLIDAVKNGRDNEAKELMLKGMTKGARDGRAELAKLRDFNLKQGTRNGAQISTTYRAAQGSVLTVCFLAIALGGAFGFVLSRYITYSIKQLVAGLESLQSACVKHLEVAMNALARGDLTHRISTAANPVDLSGKDEFGRLGSTFNALLDQTKSTVDAYADSQRNLSNLVRQVVEVAALVEAAATTLSSTAEEVESSATQVGSTIRQISSSTAQVAAGATEVATGSESQSRSLANTQEGIQYLVGSVKEVATQAQEASTAAKGADGAADDGMRAVTVVLDGMNSVRAKVAESANVIDKLGESSERIGTIIQTITDIAEQTNLLALNAAIEAARAGEAGRGFAVVADEVRKLAERSGRATHEIGVIIEEIQSHTGLAVTAMKAGSDEVERQADTAENLRTSFKQIQSVVQDAATRVEKIQSETGSMTGQADEVAKSVGEIAAVVEEASAAAAELSASADEVSSAVDGVSGEALRQTAAAEELVASAQELRNLARKLSETVGSFVIEESESGKSSSYLLQHAA